MTMAKSIVQKLSVPPALVPNAIVRKTDELIQIRYFLIAKLARVNKTKI
jgi:hypothetical protein